MPTGQQYGTNVPQTTLTSQINATTTTVPVQSSTNWPTPPFTAVIDLGNSNQEPVDVTSVVGTNWTVTRAVDGTTGFTHAINASVTHADIGRDFREARSHIDASTSNDASGHVVHGLQSGSSVVGTTDTQTLSGKTLSTATFTGLTQMGSGNWTGTGQITEAALAYSGLTGATFQTTRIVGTVSTGAAPVTGTFQLGDMVYDTFYRTFWVCTSAGSPGTWLPMGGRATLGLTALGSVNVPAWANTIRINWNARSSVAGTGGDFLDLQLNGDSTANYNWETNTATTSAASTGTNSAGNVTAIRVGVTTSAGCTSGLFGNGEITITNAQTASILRGVSSHFNTILTTTTGWSGTAGGVWNSSAAITSFNLFANGGSLAGGSNMTVEFSI